MLDKNLKAYLLEVNHAPSFNTDTDVDKKVKVPMISDLFSMLDLHNS